MSKAVKGIAGLAAAAALMFNFGGTVAAADVSMTGTDPLSVQSERRAGADTGRIGGEKQSANGSKDKTKNPTKGTGSASKKNGSVTGTNSKSKEGTTTTVVNGTNGATGNTGATTNTGAAGTTGNGVLGVQAAPATGQGTAPSGAGVGGAGAAVLGIQSLPSTSTAYLFELNGAAALAVAGLGGYVLRRYRKR